MKIRSFYAVIAHSLYALLIEVGRFIWLLVNLHKDKCYLRQRMGWHKQPAEKYDWLLHCVSVGEVVAASNLIKQVKLSQPSLRVLLTTGTETGKEKALALLGDLVSHQFLPIDSYFAMRRLFKHSCVRKVLITEVELWPNMLHICHQLNIETNVINARMTDRSCRSYQKLSWLFTPMLDKLDKVFAQGEVDYNNYQSLGMQTNKLFLPGNLKFDMTPHVEIEKEIQPYIDALKVSQRAVLLAASTHEPEESAMIWVYKTLKQAFPNLLLVIVPRHPQRFEKVHELCQSSLLNSIRISKGESYHADTDIVLVDKMGWLNALYPCCQFAFVGGSLANRGGHNALEPAYFAKPIIMGPNTYNNPQICEVLAQAGALKIAKSEDDIVQLSQTWLNDINLASEAGKAGAKVVRENQGAIQKTLAHLI